MANPLKQPYPNRAIWRQELQPGHHRLIAELSDIIERNRYSAAAITEAAGLASGSISTWRLRGCHPTIGNFDAALNVIGYELAIRRKRKPTEEEPW